MQKEKVNITLTVEGIEIPISAHRWSSEGKLYLSVGNSAKILASYIKAKFPHIKIERSSSSFANGNDIRIYVPNANDEEFEQIRTICNKFEEGTFDGMTDSYDYKDKSERLRFYYNGEELDVGAKYVFVDRYAKWKPEKESK
jgi:hypothetical protein